MQQAQVSDGVQQMRVHARMKQWEAAISDRNQAIKVDSQDSYYRNSEIVEAI